MLILLAINYHWCHCYRQLIIASVVVIGEKFIADVGIDENIANVVDTAKHKVANISENFRKNSQWPQWDTQGPGGTDS